MALARAPAEDEPVEAVLVAEWPERFEAPMSELVEVLEDHGVPVEICAEATGCPTDSVWMRDYGPLPVWGEQGQLIFGDARYFGYRDDDDAVPQVLAPRWGAEVVEIDLPLEGGNLLRDGSGLCLGGSTIHTSHSWTAEEAASRLEPAGCEQLVWLETLEGEGTHHVDVFVALSGELAVVGEGSDPVLDEAASALEAWTSVARIPQPEALDLDGDGELDFPSFTNVLRAVHQGQRLLVVPSYEALPEESAAALEQWTDLEPDWTVIGVDASELLVAGGALHCVTQTVPMAEPDEALPCGCGSTRSAGLAPLLLALLGLQRRRARPGGLAGRRRRCGAG